MDRPTALTPVTTWTPPPPVPDGAGIAAYDRQHALLCYALEHGIYPFTCSQLEDCDHAAALAVAALPSQLTPDTRRLDATLHTLRLRIATYTTSKRRQLAAVNRALDEMSQDPPTDLDQPQSQPGQPEDSDQDRAIKLLRAALLLIMGPPSQNGGGGRPARLQPRPPGKPGPQGGIHADDPRTLPAKDGINF